MRVRLFAALRELAGTSELDVDAPPDVGSLLDQLSEKLGPEFERIMRVGTVVVDGETVGREHPLKPEDEAALLPPVSGG
ncbi:MAG TPA: MoaD/ThiS family protein [Actinomycetota bacterium]|nr:MoaD/ThiS family protein [Actinomycetota bacterium]